MILNTHSYLNGCLIIVQLLRALAVSKRAGKHILLEDFMEVVGIAEADGFRDLGHRHIGSAKQFHSGVYAHTVYVIYRCLAYTLLKHLGKVVGRNVDHCGKILNIYLLSEMLVNVADNRAKS